MEEFKDQVRRGFANCRLDIDELREENSELKKHVEDLNSTISELKSELKGINIAMNYIKDMIPKQQQSKPQQVVPAVSEPIVNNIEVTSPIIPQSNENPYDALLAFKAKSNKRDILKQKLTSMVSQGGVTLSELKFLFVDHYKYCSKATFYNYLKELELERMVKIERENSKNIVFLYNQLEKEV
jgi:FtsZ-binding cell division protein ZapB